MKAFILQSGRSGSLFIKEILKKNNFKNVYHEYKLMDYKPELVTLQIKKKENYKFKFLKSFKKNYLSKIKSRDFIDVSYGITNIHCLSQIKKKFPDSKFIFIFRNGYDVVNSWFYKLGNEIYEPDSMEKLKQFILKKNVKLKREKKYWWPININKNKKFKIDDQFKYICKHWNDIFFLSKKIKKKYKNDDKFIKFEEFTKQKK